jgi:3-dehydroquinate dehydratase II
MATLLLLNGPNLNLLGSREPGVYGRTDLAEIESLLSTQAERLGHDMVCYQSNAEYQLLDRVQRARDDGIAFILLNPGALTHTSIALRDALLAVAVPFIEIHVSNTFARESFRHKSYISDIAAGCVIGLGAQGYELALQAAHKQLLDAEGD